MDTWAKSCAYAEAHTAAVNMVRMGEAKAYSVTYDSQRGRVIHVETEQGWNPEPFYEDYPLEGKGMNDGT